MRGLDSHRSGVQGLCGTTGASNRPTPSELKALEIRGAAMNHLCDGSAGEISAALCGRLATGQVTQVTRSSGFDWSDFGIGAGAMLGFVLLAGGIAAGVHYGRRGSASASRLVGAEFQDPAGAAFLLETPRPAALREIPRGTRRRGGSSCVLRPRDTTRQRLAGGCRLQPLGEELERLARLRLLLAAKVYATSGEKGPRLCSDLERLARSALGRELEDPRSVGIQPHLGDHPAIERFRGELQLEHEDRSENGQVVEREALRGVLVVEGPLLPREQPLQPPFPRMVSRTSDFGVPFIEPEQTNPPGITSTSTPNSGDRRTRPGSSDGTTGRSFTTESSPFLCTRRARATTPRSYSVRSGVSKKNTWRIWASRGSISRAATVEVLGLRHREFQLDAVGALDQVDHASEIVVRETCIPLVG